jgi:2-polyprenyl-6-hydroxyphenyl methylase/3-demethylubiquinone-9 3-methyltransferase
VYVVKKPVDRVNQAYFDELGTVFGQKVRNRINWICGEVKGPNVLDVGCSQGIVSILLGREGKNVLGIDLLEESIEYANNALEKESNPTRELVSFVNANFITHSYGEQKYDTIIFGEVLEHLTNPKDFLAHAKGLLAEDGKVIVTVPFGVNDYFDHKKTYYVNSLLELADEELKITEVRFFGKWIGAIFKINPPEHVLFDKELIVQSEEAFQEIERNANKEVSKLKKRVQDLESQLEKNNEQVTNLEAVNSSSVAQLTEEIDRLKEITENNLSDDRKRLESATQALIEEKKAKIVLQQELIDTYKYEEKLLKSYKKLSKKYDALSRSKLGKMAVNYWKFKKSLFRGK